MAKPTDEILDHNYDGIKEFNNPLPGWWLYLFLFCVLWAIIYMFYYHFSSIGDSSATEYAKEMRAYEEMMLIKNAGATEMVLTKADLTPITDKAALEQAKALYTKNCVSCHGKGGEGGVGPNLTDDYWIHGGSFENIATTIMNGVPEKGMITWKTLLKKDEILKLSSFVRTLKGTNPANPKPPQGNLFKES